MSWLHQARAAVTPIESIAGETTSGGVIYAGTVFRIARNGPWIGMAIPVRVSAADTFVALTETVEFRDPAESGKTMMAIPVVDLSRYTGGGRNHPSPRGEPTPKATP